MRVDLADGRVRRLTGGFKRDRSPRFLGAGRLVCAWSEGKRHGIDAIDLARKSARDAHRGRGLLPHARTLARRPLPGGDAQLGRRARRRSPCSSGAQQEEVRLLDASGRERGRLEASPAPREPLPRLGEVTAGAGCEV